MSYAPAAAAQFCLSAAQVRMLDAQLRQVRDQCFSSDYFAASPWRLLLAVERATALGLPYHDADSAFYPPSTAARYIAMFERDGLVERRVDPLGGPELIVMTPLGVSMLNDVFEQTALAFNEAE